jgi:uncharacterized protein (TIGR03084 family)
MDTIVSALAEQQAELSGIASSFTAETWRRPSRCEGWTVSDVVLHLAQTDELALASAHGRFGEFVERARESWATSVDEAAAAMVAREREQSASSIYERWKRGADELCEVLRALDPGRRVVWVSGELSARTLATTRLAETWIHTGDVAEAVGVALRPSDRLWHVARLAWRTLPYAFARAGRVLVGPVAFELRAPGGEQWNFSPDTDVQTVIRGDALELCLVAARRAEPGETSLRGDGPDADAVLELVRTYA